MLKFFLPHIIFLATDRIIRKKTLNFVYRLF